jgi:hypothetical protein
MNPRLVVQAAIALLLAGLVPAGPAQAGYEARGRLLAHDGSPAAGIVVYVVGLNTRAGNAKIGRFDPRVTTDAEGRFTIHSDLPLANLTVAVDAPGHVPNVFFRMRPGPDPIDLKLRHGSTITGRVLRKAMPAAGVVVEATAAAKFTLGPQDISATTDADGRFVLEHVPPGVPCAVYTAMQPLAATNEAAIVRTLTSPRDEESLELGELNLHPAHTIRGRVASLAGDLPPNLHVRIDRHRLRDRQDVPVDVDGRFTFSGVPAEIVSLTVHAEKRENVPGLVLATGLPGRWQRISLYGRVDEDVEIDVLLERGSPQTASPIEFDKIIPSSVRALRGLPKTVVRERTGEKTE